MLPKNDLFGCRALLTALDNWVGRFTLIETFAEALLFGILNPLETHVP